MNVGEYLTAYERRRRLRDELRFWRWGAILAAVAMLCCFFVGLAAVGALLGVIAFASVTEAASVRRRLDRLVEQIRRREVGGPVPDRGWYVVGEKGPEWFLLSTSGVVQPWTGIPDHWPDDGEPWIGP